jgi:mono/diheme cytochrome c family protein
MVGNRSIDFVRGQGGIMVRRVLVGVAVMSLWAAVAHAQPQVKKEAIKPVAASNADAMFQSYCAACHGKSAKGDGPAAAALKKAPADLTRISARNGGKFPDVMVKRYIEGLDEVAAHGSRDMPMWGSLFRDLDRNTAQIRVQALNDYLKGLQQP